MNNDLQAVIDGSKTVRADAGRRGQRAEGVGSTATVLPRGSRRREGASASRDGDRNRDDPRPETRLALRQRALREAGWGYAFVLLPMAVFGIFFLYPFGYAIYISFFDWGILGKSRQRRDAELPRRSSHDPIFHTALKNTLEYTVVVVPLEMALGLSMALVVNAEDPRQGVLPLGVLLPVDRLVRRDHDDRDLHPQRQRPAQPRSSAVTARGSAIRAPRSGRSSASTPGRRRARSCCSTSRRCRRSRRTSTRRRRSTSTSAWRTFWRITFPLLKPAHFFVLVVFGIGALKIFDQAFIVSGGTGGPQNSTYTAVLYIYLQGVPRLRLRDRRRGRGRPLRHHLRPDRRSAGDGRASGERHDAPDVRCAAEPLVPSARAVGGRAQGRALRRCSLAIALLFFVPFIWTLVTSFKTIPDSVELQLHPAPLHDVGVADGLDEVRLQALHPQQPLPRRHRHRPEHVPRRPRRLRVRPAALPGPRAPVPARARDADGPRPAAPDPRVRDAHELAPDRQLHGATS